MDENIDQNLIHGDYHTSAPNGAPPFLLRPPAIIITFVAGRWLWMGWKKTPFKTKNPCAVPWKGGVDPACPGRVVSCWQTMDLAGCWLTKVDVPNAVHVLPVPSPWPPSVLARDDPGSSNHRNERFGVLGAPRSLSRRKTPWVRSPGIDGSALL